MTSLGVVPRAICSDLKALTIKCKYAIIRYLIINGNNHSLSVVCRHALEFSVGDFCYVSEIDVFFAVCFAVGSEASKRFVSSCTFGPQYQMVQDRDVYLSSFLLLHTRPHTRVYPLYRALRDALTWGSLMCTTQLRTVRLEVL